VYLVEVIEDLEDPTASIFISLADSLSCSSTLNMEAAKINTLHLNFL
jgi:uncharacterized membrane protein